MRKGSSHLEFHPWTTEVWAAGQGCVPGQSEYGGRVLWVGLPTITLSCPEWFSGGVGGEAVSFLLGPMSPQVPGTTMLPALWDRMGRAGKEHMGGVGVGLARGWTRDRRDNETSIPGVPVVR